MNKKIKVACSSYDKYRRSYEDTSVKELKMAIGAALKAEEYQLAVTLLFFGYVNCGTYFHGCEDICSNPTEKWKEKVLMDLKECSQESNILTCIHTANGNSYVYPDGIDAAIKEVQEKIISQHYPEAIGAEEAIVINTPIKIGDYLYAFALDPKNQELKADEVNILAFSNCDGTKRVLFNCFPQGVHAKSASYTYDGSKDHWGIEVRTYSYGDTEYTRMQVIRSSSKSNLYCGFGYDEKQGVNHRLDDVVARFQCQTMEEVVTLLTPLYNNLKTVWTNIAPDYRDVWFLPQVVSYYGNKHLTTMQKLLPQVNSYSVKKEAASGGGYGFWSD